MWAMFSQNKLGVNLWITKKVKQVFIALLKLWIDQGREIYNNLMQKWLDNNDILMCSRHNKVKIVVAERIIRTFKNYIILKNLSKIMKSS